MAEKNTISQRISLEGAQEINALLDALGKAGEATFNRIKAAAEKVNPAITGKLEASIKTFRTNMEALNVAGARVGLAVVNLQNRFAAFGASLGTVATRLGLVTIAALGTITAFLKLGRSAIAAVDEADTLAQSLGLTIEQYSGLAGAAAQNNVAADTLFTGLTQLNNKIADTADASKGASGEMSRFGDQTIKVHRGVDALAKAAKDNDNALNKLGISTRTAKGELRSANDVILDIADVFSKMPDGAKKSALAVELFGRSGARMIPFLNEGAAGIRRITADAAAMGTVFTEQDKKVARLADQGLDRLGEAIRGARIQLGLLFAPAIAGGANFLANLIRDNLELIKEFGRVVVQSGSILLADFIALLLGADERVENTWLIGVRDGVVAFANTVREVVFGVIIPAWQLIRSGAEEVAVVINRVFGTELTGQQVLVGAAVLKLSGAFGVLSASIGVMAGVVNLLLVAWRPLAALVPFLTSGFAVLGRAIAIVFTGLAAVLGLPVTVVAAIVAAVAAAAVATYIYWDEIKAAADVAWEGIKSGARSALQFVRDQFRDPESFTNQWITPQLEAYGTFWSNVALLAQVGVEQVKLAIQGIATGAASLWVTVQEQAAVAWTAISTFIVDTIIAIGPQISAAATTVAAVWSSAIDTISGLGGVLQGAWDSALSAMSSAFSSFAASIRSTIDSLRSAISSLVSAANSAFQKARDATGFAGGGPVYGAGTATSDSIPAWLSNGEFVIRAAAVGKVGRAFLHMINSGRFSIEDILRRLQGGKFAIGGVVGAMPSFNMPRLAMGGEVRAVTSSGQVVNLHLDGNSFPLTGAADVVATLAAHMRQRASRAIGKKSFS